MMEQLNLVLPTTFGFSALMYLWLAVRVSRASAQSENNAISYFLFLIAAMVAGSAFAFGATDENMYGIGRTLTFFSAGFLPIVFYSIYREYTVGPPHALVLAVLSIVPVITTVLAITNPLHHMIWTIVETADGSRFTDAHEPAPASGWSMASSRRTGSPAHRERRLSMYSRMARTGLTGSTPDSWRNSGLPRPTATATRPGAASARVASAMAVGVGCHR